jgi:hypothetical protein
MVKACFCVPCAWKIEKQQENPSYKRDSPTPAMANKTSGKMLSNIKE